MPVVEVKHVQMGSRLDEDVYTMLGGILFSKGTLLMERELEILQAFFINEVSIEEDEQYKLEKKRKDKEKEKEMEAEVEALRQRGKLLNSKREFDTQFDLAVSAFKSSMAMVRKGERYPC